MLTVGSLFSGIGGLDLGLERAGFQVSWQVEIDDYCSRVLAQHWPDVARFRDVRDCHGAGTCPVAHPAGERGRCQNRDALHEGRPASEVGTARLSQTARRQDGIAESDVGATGSLCVGHLPYVDLICGGFPCQPVSHAGRRKGKADDRWLWPEFYRIIREVRPRWALIENVRGLLSADAGRIFAGILRDLAQAGYDADWDIVSAASVGAPHLRERVFVVAHTERRGRMGADQPQSGSDRERAAPMAALQGTPALLL